MAFPLSIFDLLWRAANPASAVLVVPPGGAAYDTPEGESVRVSAPGLIVFRFSAPLFFANAARFRADVDALVGTADPPVRWFVLDASGIDDIDTTGAKALREVIERLQAAGIAIGIARCQPTVAALLDTYGLSEVVGADRLYDTDHDAVAALSAMAPGDQVTAR